MRISDISGKRQIKLIGRLMTLADRVSQDPNFKEFLDAVRNKGSKLEIALKLGPLLERDDVADDVIGIVAYAKGISLEEADQCNIIAEFIELVSSDMELPAFLSDQPQAEEIPGTI